MSSADRLPDSLPTVAELLSEHGYHTKGISHNGQLHTNSGLTRGFDDYEPFHRFESVKTAPVEILRRLCLHPWKHGGGLTTDSKRHPLSSVLTDRAIRAFRNASSPLFTYVHYNDVHLPYLPPANHLTRYLPDGVTRNEAIQLAVEMWDSKHEHIANGLPYSERDWKVVSGLYDAVLEYNSEQVGRLIEYIQSHHPETIIVVTADHGEYLGEHGLLAHILRTEDAVSSVPLVVAGPTEITAHKSDRVQHIDVITTILNELGVESPSLQGVDLRSETRNVSVTQRGGKRAAKIINNISSLGGEKAISDVPHGLVSTFRSSGGRLDVRGGNESVLTSADEIPTEASVYAENFFETVGQPRQDHVETSLSSDAKNRLSELGYLVE